MDGRHELAFADSFVAPSDFLRYGAGLPVIIPPLLSSLVRPLAFLVLNYDLKLADGGAAPGARPPNVYFREHVFPNPAAEVLFRKRRPVEVAA